MNDLWWLVAVGYLVGGVLALRDRPRSGEPPADGPELEPVEVGALFSYPHAVAVAITELCLLERITLEGGGRLRRRGTESTSSLRPFIAALLRKVPRSTTTSYGRLLGKTGPEWRNLGAELTVRGYLGQPPGRWRVIADLLLAMLGILLGPVGVVVFGSPAPTGLRWAFGAMAAVLLVRAAVLIVEFLRGRYGRGRRLRRTRRGDRAIRDLKQRYRHLVPALRPSMELYGPRESAMAVALFGSAGVNSIDLMVRTVPPAGRRAPGQRRPNALFGGGSSLGSSVSCAGARGVWRDHHDDNDDRRGSVRGGHRGGGGGIDGCGAGGCGE